MASHRLNRSLFGAHRLFHSVISPTQMPHIESFLTKGFSEINSESTGKALHGLYMKGFVPLSVFHSNTIVNMYAKLGFLRDAQTVFDEMTERNGASWNTMMSGYVRARSYQRAFRFFKEMLCVGVKPNGVSIASLVTACDKSGSMFGEGLQVHGFVVKLCLLCDVFVGTSLLHFYGTFGLVSDSRKLFDEMPEKNVVTWTSLMVGYLDGEEFDKVIDLYERMRFESVPCNENTFTLVFKTCGVLGDPCLGSRVLGRVVKSGLETNVSVANSLIHMHGCCGEVEEACRVFDRMSEWDTISWNSILSANAQNGRCEETLRYFRFMRRTQRDSNSTALSSLLSVCGSSPDHSKWGAGIHGLVLKLGLDSNVCVGNSLLNMYSDAGKAEDAESVFRRMPERDSISWNSMLACYAANELSRKALSLIGEMRRCTSKNIGFVTLTSALAACSNRDFGAEGKMVHALAIVSGLQTNLVVGNALVTMYGKSRATVQSRRVLRIMPERDDVTWNALIGCHSENKETDKAVRAFKEMRNEGVQTNYITVVNVLGGLSSSKNHLAPIHGYCVRAGFDSDKQVQTSLVTAYAECGDLSSSVALFEGLSTKYSITWNAVIAANAHHGRGSEALRLVSEMRRLGLRLDQFGLSVAISVCADMAALEEGQKLHGLAAKLGLESDRFVSNVVMDMYAKCGSMESVLRILPRSRAEMTRLSWNVLISSYARNGLFDEARESFSEMVRLGPRPDHVTFVSLLSACSHGGLVDEGQRYYAAMTAEFGVAPAIEHCVCIVDLLGRSGRLREAIEFVWKMPVKPNDLVWRSLLSSCLTHRDLELAKTALEKLLELDPNDDSALVLYSNVCAAGGRWEDAEGVWAHMESKKIRKLPAYSVGVRGRNRMMGTLGSGEESRAWNSQIYAES